MRIQVTGNCEPAKAVRKGLMAEGFAVTDSFASYQILVEQTDGEIPEVDGIDCELERQIVNCISKLADTDVLLRRCGGVRSDQKIRIAVPRNEAVSAQVEQAIIKGFALATNTRPDRRLKWFARF